MDDPGTFAGRFNEVKGDIYAAQGKADDARNAYLAAMVASGSELLDRNFLQMKLNDLPPANSADESGSHSGEPNAGQAPSGAAGESE